MLRLLNTHAAAAKSDNLDDDLQLTNMPKEVL